MVFQPLLWVSISRIPIVWKDRLERLMKNWSINGSSPDIWSLEFMLVWPLRWFSYIIILVIIGLLSNTLWFLSLSSEIGINVLIGVLRNILMLVICSLLTKKRLLLWVWLFWSWLKCLMLLMLWVRIRDCWLLVFLIICGCGELFLCLLCYIVWFCMFLFWLKYFRLCLCR